MKGEFMFFNSTISELKSQKEKIELALASLENLEGISQGNVITTSLPIVPQKRHGRSFTPQQRLEVGARMKKIWAIKRNNKNKIAPVSPIINSNRSAVMKALWASRTNPTLLTTHLNSHDGASQGAQLP
jgi:hypothetical protein